MRCSNLLDGHPCGADIPPSALFCASCGGVVPNSVSSTKPCLQCGNLVTKSQKYCSNCAWKIDQNIFEEVAITCNGEKEDGSTCGTELPKNSKFCPECATPVNNKGRFVIYIIYKYRLLTLAKFKICSLQNKNDMYMYMEYMKVWYTDNHLAN